MPALSVGYSFETSGNAQKSQNDGRRFIWPPPSPHSAKICGYPKFWLRGHAPPTADEGTKVPEFGAELPPKSMPEFGASGLQNRQRYYADSRPLTDLCAKGCIKELAADCSAMDSDMQTNGLKSFQSDGERTLLGRDDDLVLTGEPPDGPVE